MDVIIVAGGVIKNYSYIKNLIDTNKFIICADSGYDHLKNMNITPDLVIGDFDSIKSDVLDVKTVSYSKFKDYTDTELAINYAINMGACNIHLFGALGNRVDHFLGNILFLKKYLDDNIKITIYDDCSIIYPIKNDLKLNMSSDSTLSLIPLCDCFGIKTSGLYWNLNNENLPFGTTRGISNVVVGNNVSISLKKGVLLAIAFFEKMS